MRRVGHVLALVAFCVAANVSMHCGVIISGDCPLATGTAAVRASLEDYAALES
jgi:hypothetical protein